MEIFRDQASCWDKHYLLTLRLFLQESYQLPRQRHSNFEIVCGCLYSGRHKFQIVAAITLDGRVFFCFDAPLSTALEAGALWIAGTRIWIGMFAKLQLQIQGKRCHSDNANGPAIWEGI